VWSSWFVSWPLCQKGSLVAEFSRIAFMTQLPASADSAKS